MNQEYLATRFKVAIETLKSALELCGPSNCSPATRAQILRDMGVVYVAGMKDEAQGKKAFADALAADPGVALDPALTNPTIQRVFDEARGAARSASGGEKPKRKHKARPGLSHTPVERQLVGTPVPVYVELSDDIEATMVRLYFKGPDMQTWDSVKMHRVGDGYGAEIPCSALPAHGSVRYYVHAIDDDAVVAKAGSAEDPFEVQFVDSLDDEEPPHLPDAPPPGRCEGFEGGGGTTTAGHSRVWLMAGLAQDVAFLSGTDVCTKDSQVNQGYACFRSSGSQYLGTPVVGQGDKINAGFAIATTRILAGGEYLLSTNISVGVRLGYAFRGGPQPDGGNKFFPFHLEARASYWFGDKGLHAGGISPFAFVGGGMAQIDAEHTVPVLENPNAAPNPAQPDNPSHQNLDAWRKMGTSFAALGAGAYIPVAKKSGIIADLKGMLLFPSSGTAASVELGYAFGL